MFADDPQQAGDEAGEGNAQVQLQTGDGHAVFGAWQVILFKVKLGALIVAEQTMHILCLF